MSATAHQRSRLREPGRQRRLCFPALWPESWGPRLDYILTNAVRALLDVSGGTLLMLPRLLIDEAFRVQLVEEHVADPYVRAFWLGALLTTTIA